MATHLLPEPFKGRPTCCSGCMASRCQSATQFALSGTPCLRRLMKHRDRGDRGQCSSAPSKAAERRAFAEGCRRLHLHLKGLHQPRETAHVASRRRGRCKWPESAKIRLDMASHDMIPTVRLPAGGVKGEYLL